MVDVYNVEFVDSINKLFFGFEFNYHEYLVSIDFDKERVDLYDPDNAKHVNLSLSEYEQNCQYHDDRLIPHGSVVRFLD